jgi:hypothetical protein
MTGFGMGTYPEWCKINAQDAQLLANKCTKLGCK